MAIKGSRNILTAFINFVNIMNRYFSISFFWHIKEKIYHLITSNHGLTYFIWSSYKFDIETKPTWSFIKKFKYMRIKSEWRIVESVSKYFSFVFIFDISNPYIDATQRISVELVKSRGLLLPLKHSLQTFKFIASNIQMYCLPRNGYPRNVIFFQSWFLNFLMMLTLQEFV